MNAEDIALSAFALLLGLFFLWALIDKVLHRYRVNRNMDLAPWQRRAMMEKRQAGFEVVQDSTNISAPIPALPAAEIPLDDADAGHR